MGRPNFFEDAKKATDLMREHRSLSRLLDSWDAFGKAQTELEENREMAKSLDDRELAEMAAAETPALEQRLVDLERPFKSPFCPQTRWKAGM